MIKLHLENTSLRVQGSRLHRSLEFLEVVTSLEIPKVHCTVVCPGHKHIVSVHCQTVDDGVVAGKVLDKLALRELPLLDVVGTSAGEHVQFGMHHKPADRLFVVGESGHALACSEIPQPDGRVIAASYDLGICGLTEDASNCVSVTT